MLSLKEFVALAHAYPWAFMRAELEKRLKKLVQDASHTGWGYGDAIDELVQEVLRLKGDT